MGLQVNVTENWYISSNYCVWYYRYIYNYLLSSIIIYYHPLSSIIIYYHPLSSIIIYHLLSSIIIYYHPLSSIIIYYHPFSSITIHYHLLSSIIHYHPLSPIIIHYHLLCMVGISIISYLQVLSQKFLVNSLEPLQSLTETLLKSSKSTRDLGIYWELLGYIGISSI